MTYFILMGPKHEHGTFYGASMCQAHPGTSRESDSIVSGSG